jgi:LysR family transcriptional regulator, carnitine catabolism transcriptional activator
MPIRTARLAHFLAVVDHGTVTAGAAAEFVSQPALSQSLKELERELGVALFDRVGRALRLTAAGEALVEPARQVLRDVQNAAAAVAAVAEVVAGRLDLACLPTLAVDPMARLVGAFRAAHPGVTVRLADPDDPAGLLGQVRSGEVEVAVTEMPDPTPAGLVVHRLAAQDLVWIVPPGDAASAFVTTPPGTSSRRHLEDACAREGTALAIAVETAQREAIVPLVVAGAGAALFPRALAQTAIAHGARVRPCRPPARRAIALVHRPGPLSPAAQRFRALALDADEPACAGERVTDPDDN